jgi:class 3 adenylate cyclase
VENKNYGFIKPEHLRPELSTKLYKTTFNYLNKFYSPELFYQACAELKMPRDYLLDDDNWVSVEFGKQFAEKIRQKTGDEEVYKKIGRFYFSPENISSFDFAVIKSLSPFMLLKQIEKFYPRGNLVCSVQLRKNSVGNFTIQISSDKKMYIDMAYNSLGITESFKELYKLESFESTLKIDDEDNLKTFSLNIKFSAVSYYIKRAFALATMILGGSAFGGLLYISERAHKFPVLIPLGLITFFCFIVIYKMSQNIKIFKNSNEEFYLRTREKNATLFQKAELLERRYQEANLLKELSAELVACKDSSQVITKCLQSIKTKFNYKKAAVFLLSRERGKLYLANSIGFESSNLNPGSLEFLYPNPDKKEGFIATVLERGLTSLIFDVDQYKQILKPMNAKILEALNVDSLIISPIQSGSNKFGAFVLIRDSSEPSLDKPDKFLVENITAHLSLYFESAGNFENETKLRQIFQKYVPKEVLEQITSNLHTSDGMLKPQKKEICSMFMDLRGFTAACDGVAPEKAFLLINLFSDFATKILSEEGAIIDNIIGDEIVSFFPCEPADPHSHIFRAIKAANKISQNFSSFLQTLKQNGFPSLRLGIGINCGAASIGSVGSDAKINFTALGTTVNVASRLQSISKKYPGEVVTVISRSTLEKIDAVNISYQQEVLRGTSQATEFSVFEAESLSSLLSLKQKDEAA